jgi:hypothetical protein
MKARNRTVVTVLVVILFLVCNWVACLVGMAAGGALGALRSHRCGRRMPLVEDYEGFHHPPERMPSLPRPRVRPDTRFAAQVLKVVEGGPADEAGFEEGDLILAIDGERIERDADLVAQIAQHEPGDRIRLLVRRGARVRSVQVRIGRRSAESDAPYLGLTYRLVPVVRGID